MDELTFIIIAIFVAYIAPEILGALMGRNRDDQS